MIGRYEHPTIIDLWSPTSIIDRWVLVEIEVLRARGIDGETLDGMVAQRPTPIQVLAREQATNHEFVAFLDAWRQNLEETGINCPSHLHAGLTSSDVIDTAQALALVASHELVKNLLHELTGTVEARSDRSSTAQIGRTHGQYAEPYPASHPWTVFVGMLDRQALRLSRAGSGLWSAKLSGPVGWNGPQGGPVVGRVLENKILRKLGLIACDSTQIVPRDGLAHWVGTVAELATICEAIATRVRLWSQSGVDEYWEATRPDQVGSSAMPHKQHNPLLSENICGLARMVRTQAATLQQGVVQWWDRDLSHSSVERVMLPDLCHLICTILVRTHTLIDGLSLNEGAVAANLQKAEARKEATLDERMIGSSGDLPNAG